MSTAGGPARAWSSMPVSWQVDIPGLSALVGRIGAEGLKQLALEGVDVNTIGCALTLAELAPASVEFRYKLQKHRVEQRAQSWKFYDIIEYGAGTNFVADELLKTRPGENALALMVAVASVMDGEEAIEVLLSLFEEMKIPVYSTPGVGQLKALRSAVLPLLRKAHFGDRLAELNLWLSNQFAPADPRWFDPNGDPASMVELIRLLSHMVLGSGDKPNRLAFYGISGAAWLMLYSTDILGLPVCLIHKDGKVHPVNGDFASAKVLIFPENSGRAQILESIDNPLDVVVCTTHGGSRFQPVWLLSCGEEGGGVDLFKLMCGWNVQARREIGNLVYSMAMEYLGWHTGSYSSSTPGFVSYYASGIGELEERLGHIVPLFGFPGQFQFNRKWRDSFQIPDTVVAGGAGAVTREGGARKAELCLQLFKSMIVQPEVKSYDYCQHLRCSVPELKDDLPYCPRCRLLECVKELSFAASCLAFSDWHRDFRKLSTRVLSGGASNTAQHSYEFFNWVFDRPAHRDDGLRPQLLRASWDEHPYMAYAIAELCSSSEETVDIMRRHRNGFIGLNLDGVLLIEHAAVSSKLGLMYRFMLREGEFYFSGGRRPSLAGPTSAWVIESNNCSVNLQTRLQPFDHFSKVSLPFHARLEEDSISIGCTFNHKDEAQGRSLGVEVPIMNIVDALQKLLVTQPCDHGYRSPLTVTPFHPEIAAQGGPPDQSRYWKDQTGAIWHVRGNLYQHPSCSWEQNPDGLPSDVYSMYPVDGNEDGQWVSLALCSQGLEREGIVVWQKDACLACVRSRASSRPGSPGAFRVHQVINGTVSV
ncbi:hypothetical protein GP486_002519 [Trichoglossum hirsutum]|uniref:Uncharacterized protein n=1 Tax=Trichoglossum hirsutum TaxID=265104 RepID=A0A9P8RS15_9PEZI|nr:hypothetical protein GP486_002519 [Trichoglossum hirsutum]